MESSLHNTVIRIALVKLCKSYSRISLAEIASVLQLDGAEEARYTCMRVCFGIGIEGRTFATASSRDRLRETIS